MTDEQIIRHRLIDAYRVQNAIRDHRPLRIIEEPVMAIRITVRDRPDLGLQEALRYAENCLDYYRNDLYTNALHFAKLWYAEVRDIHTNHL